MLLSGVGTNAIGFDLSPEVSRDSRLSFSCYFGEAVYFR
jgi:hypothetical protein